MVATMAVDFNGQTNDDSPRFRDRRDAGRRLASLLSQYAGREDLIVLALPRGGVPVGYEVARALGAPLDLVMVRKLGVPGQEELAFGAIASHGVRILNDSLVRALGLGDRQIEEITSRQQIELARREKLYRRDQPALPVKDKTVIIVDDGLATGATMHAAVTSVSALAPRQVIVAVPVAAPETCREFCSQAQSLTCHCLLTPEDFQAVGLWFDDFSQTTDEEVSRLLALSRDHLSGIG